MRTRRLRTRRLLLPLAACVLALGVTATPATAASADPAQLVLRLPDLPAGYGLLSRECSRRETPLSDLAPSADRSCESYFARFWTTPDMQPGPAVVISAAVVLKTAQRAAVAFEDPRHVASLLSELDREDFNVVEPAPAIGDEAVLLRATDGSAVVVWRSGPVLAALLAAPGRHARNDINLQATIALATAQQTRIAAPTPVRPADNDSSEVALDNPGLTLPVWWLDRELLRRGKLPALRLLTSVPSGLFDDAGPDFGPTLLYGHAGARSDVVLTLVRPSLLRRPAMRRYLRRMRRDPCSMVRHVARSDGRATIFQRSPRCPKLDVRETPDALDDTTAVVVLPGVVVFAYADACVSCRGPVSRYESIAGMRRIVKALRLREPSESTTP
jgi:antitoxin (DNA-binding transcriptional repressor) of toxin-antitoxin stability system